MTRDRLLRSTLLAAALCVAAAIPVHSAPRGRVLTLGDRLERLPATDGAGFRAEVELGGLDLAERIELELPGGQLASAARSGVERRGDGDLLWTGRTALGEEVVLTVVAGRLAGTVFARSGAYQIFPDGEASHRVQEVDPGKLPPCGGAPLPEPGAGGEELGARGATAPGASASQREPAIDVLVAYTRETTATVGSKRNVRVVVQHYVDLTNVAFHNSEVGARIRLVHAAEVVVPAADALDHGSLLSWMRSSPVIADLRDTHGADLTGLVYENGTSVCGAAAMIYRPGGPARGRAYFVSRRSCGADTFAHEVGHLMGGDHNPEDANVAAGRYLYGRGHYHDGLYRTLMSYTTACAGACPSQPFFSNPGVRYDSRPTGLRDERDNARILDEFAAEVERFSPGINDPGCDLSPGDPDYCLECGPCRSGEGNCEADSECDSGLACAPGSGADFGFGAGVDVCLATGGCDLDPGDPDYCRLCGPCGYGAGDCDGDRECQPGLICLDDVGEIFGQPPASDVCAFRENGFCPLAPGDRDYCAVCGPCLAGEGNCQSNSECNGLLTCFPDVGGELGFKAGTDVCLQAAPSSCPFEPGSPDYCKLCGVCDLGEGDCDGDRECRSGLSCVDGAGAALGFGDAIDVCLESLPPPRRLKAKALSSTRVRLKWKERSKNEDGFHVEMSVAGGPFVRIESTGANRRKLFVDGLSAGTTYAFRVQAFNSSGTSGYSNTKSVTTP